MYETWVENSAQMLSEMMSSDINLSTPMILDLVLEHDVLALMCI